MAYFTVCSVEESLLCKWISLFIPEFLHPSAGLLEKIRELPEIMLIKKKLKKKSLLTVKGNNHIDQILIKKGRGASNAQYRSEFAFLPLGSKALGKNHTHISRSFCLFFLAGSKPCPCVRGSGGCGSLWDIHRCALPCSCIPVQLPNSPEGFHLGAREEKCFNSTGEISGTGGGRG